MLRACMPQYIIQIVLYYVLFGGYACIFYSDNLFSVLEIVETVHADCTCLIGLYLHNTLDLNPATSSVSSLLFNIYCA